MSCFIQLVPFFADKSGLPGLEPGTLLVMSNALTSSGSTFRKLTVVGPLGERKRSKCHQYVGQAL